MFEASLPIVTRPYVSSGSDGKYVTEDKMYAAELNVDAALPPEDPSVVVFMSSESDSRVLREFFNRRL